MKTETADMANRPYLLSLVGGPWGVGAIFNHRQVIAASNHSPPLYSTGFWENFDEILPKLC
jgi:hypothetical protein